MSRRRTRLAVAVALTAVLLTGCGPTGRQDPTPSAAATLEATVPAFQTFSGLTVPPTAKEVSLTVVQDPSGAPAYRVEFSLPSAQVDAYCTGGRLQTPLETYTVPPYVAELFDYDAGAQDPDGVKVAEGGLPDRVTRQRTVLATGTDTSTAVVRTYAYELPR